MSPMNPTNARACPECGAPRGQKCTDTHVWGGEWWHFARGLQPKMFPAAPGGLRLGDLRCELKPSEPKTIAAGELEALVLRIGKGPA